MEIDQLKSRTEDQMEMMMMMSMMQTDKLPDSYGGYNDVVEFPPTDQFSTGATNNSNTTNNNNIINANNILHFAPSPSFMNLPINNNIPFTTTTTTTTTTTNPVHQDPSAPLFLTNSSTGGRERSGGANAYSVSTTLSQKRNSMAAMREMIFRMAAMQPIHIDPESVKAPKRRNVKISKDPQSVAARHRRERISERIRILQRLVPGGTKMDTASMLDEAIHYVKFLKTQVQSLERAAANRPATTTTCGIGFPVPMSNGSSHIFH